MTSPIIESEKRYIGDYGETCIEHHVSVGNWHSYTSDGTLVLRWGDPSFKKNIWCCLDRGELADLVALYERQIELDEIDQRGATEPGAPAEG